MKSETQLAMPAAKAKVNIAQDTRVETINRNRKGYIWLVNLK